MEYILAIFRSRTQTLSFAQILSSYNVKNNVINTPKQAGVACGISVSFSLHDYPKALAIFTRRRFDSFVGFYRVYQNQSTFIIYPYH